MNTTKDNIWEYDELHDQITIMYTKIMAEWMNGERKNYETHVSATIRTSKTGFIVNIKSLYREKSGSLYIPGDYALEEICRYIGKEIYDSEDNYYENYSKKRYKWYTISDALLETEMWDRRGYLANSRSFPIEMFQKIPMDVFAKAGTKSYRQWLEKAFLNQTAFTSMPKGKLKKFIDSGSLPARVHSMRGWQKFTRSEIAWIMRTEAWKNPSWGMFVSQYLETYGQIFSAHHEAWLEFEHLLAVIIKFPKIPRVRLAIEQIYNSGESIKPAFELRSARELDAYADACAERYAALKKENDVLHHYAHPKLSLPEGWSWATKSTFWNLGTLYNCCISSNGYAQRLEGNHASVAYRPDFSRGSDGGALCFFTKSIDKKENPWTIQEIRGWCNHNVKPDYYHQAEEICKSLNLIKPPAKKHKGLQFSHA